MDIENISFMKHVILFISLSLIGIAQSWSQATESYTNSNNPYQKALSLYRQKRYKPAQQIFREQYNHSQNVDIRKRSQYYIASIALILEEPEADVLMQKFVNKNPNSPFLTEAYTQMANFYFQKENYDLALQWYEKLDETEIYWQDKDDYNFQKGYSLFVSGQHQEAETYFIKVRSSKELGKQANYYLGYIAYDSDDYTAASAYFENIQNDDEQLNKNLSYFQADINFKQGNFQQAILEGKKQLTQTRNPQDASELNKIIGESYFNLKQYDEALPYLKNYKGKKGKYTNTDYYYIGYAYYQQKKYTEAIEQFNKIIDGKDAVAQNAYYHLAECYLKTNQKQQALNAFRNAYQMDFSPQIKKDAHLNYARLSYDIGNPYESVPKVLLTYQKEYPNDNKQEIERLLIDSYISSRNYQAAIELLENSNNPQDKAVYLKVAFYRGLELFNELQYQNALIYLKKATQTTGEIGAKALYWSGETAYQLQDFATAKNYFLQFINNPKAPSTVEYRNIYYNLAYADFNQKNYKEAIEYFNKYLDTKPTNQLWASDATLRLADAYFVEGKYWPAMDTYNKVIANKAEDEDYAAYQKAISYGFVDRTLRKIEDLEAFVNKYTTSNLRPLAMFELANTYVSQGNENKALQLYNRIQSEYREGNYASRSMLREGLVYYNQRNNEKALEIFRKIATLYPNTTEAIQAVATAKLIYVDIGKVDEYANWAKKLGFVNVTDTELEAATYESAERLYMQQLEKEAIESFEKYLSQFPQGLRENNARFYLAQLYYKTNQKNKALPLYERVIESGTNEFTEQALVKFTQILLDEHKGDKALPYLEKLENLSAITQNKVYAQSNLMQLYYKEKDYPKSITYANKILAEKSVDIRVKNDAYIILARSYMKTNDPVNARKAYAQVQKTATGSLAAEALYYDAYFKHQDKNYQKSNQTIQQLAKEYGSYKEFAAKGLVVMAKNFHALGDAYQASYILESVIANFADYPEVIEQAQQELLKVKEQAAENNSSVQL